MEPHEPTHTMTATEARQGQKLNMVRWVLIFGLALVIPALGLAWFFIRP